ncbi:unnamed protein product [Paramecium sonneborni]|uniref:RING-type domain-containing protein n=1 Tax=Paramecium sonneborni TaxID=65129 RepID=A0A8S1QP67_9CILI|nr:unnamed protein product [Paramecium sonneborni]
MNNNNNQNFTIQNIPEHINQLVNFKKWRRVGSKLQAAIMIGIIEYFIYNNEIDKLKEIVSSTSCQGSDKAKKFKSILELGFKNCQGTQIIDYLYQQLKEKDQYNSSPSEFFEVFLKQKFKYTLSECESIEKIEKIFKIKLIIEKWPAAINQNCQPIDSKDKNTIIIFNLDQKFYVIQKDLNLQNQFCQYCKIEKQGILKMQCKHVICLTCLKNFFFKNQNDVNCNQINCPSVIKYSEFQLILQKLGHVPLNQNNQADQISPLESCDICQTKLSVEFLLSPRECTHQFCIQCLQIKFKNNVQNNFDCPMDDCKSKLKQIYLPSNSTSQLLKSQTIQKQTDIIRNSDSQQKQQLLSNAIISNNQKSMDINSKCNYCLNQPKDHILYKLKCNHMMCWLCFLKIQNRHKGQFMCYVSNCQVIIELTDLIQYFSITQNQTIQSICGNCDSQCNKKESFCNTNCNHCICFQCVINIYKLQRTPKCIRCNIIINEDFLDEYYFKQQVHSTKDTSELKRYDPEFQKDCTFCHSPFTEYNRQQNLDCKYHAIGTCCAIFPLDCPQCQMQSLIMEKQKLHFFLFYYDQDFIQCNTQGKQK